MTTVDSWPKTLHMMSAPSWNSTTETHLMIITNCVIIFMNLYKIKGVLGSWKLWFSNINEFFLLKNQNFGSFRPIIDFELKRKRSRAEPSWKSFSSSSGSSQLGSDSSLKSAFIAYVLFVGSVMTKKQILNDHVYFYVVAAIEKRRSQVF